MDEGILLEDLRYRCAASTSKVHLRTASLFREMQAALDARLLLEELRNGCATSTGTIQLRPAGHFRAVQAALDARVLHEELRYMWNVIAFK